MHVMGRKRRGGDPVAEHERWLADAQRRAERKVALLERVYLRVPYEEREAAKALGARWDRWERQWWIEATMDPEPFARWSPVLPDAAADFRFALRTIVEKARDRDPA
jgi:hypothetical protein